MTKKNTLKVPAALKMLDDVQPEKNSRGLTTYSSNPFMENFLIETKKRRAYIAGGTQIKGEVVDAETGEVKDEIKHLHYIGEFEEVDQASFIKIYTSQSSDMFKLSKSAQRIMQLVLYQIQTSSINKAEILFNLSHAQKICVILNEPEVSKTVYRAGIAELIEKNILARGPFIGQFWTNPAVLFNGDRCRFVKEYVIKRNEDNERTLEQANLLEIAEKKLPRKSFKEMMETNIDRDMEK